MPPASGQPVDRAKRAYIRHLHICNILTPAAIAAKLGCGLTTVRRTIHNVQGDDLDDDEDYLDEYFDQDAEAATSLAKSDTRKARVPQEDKLSHRRREDDNYDEEETDVEQQGTDEGESESELTPYSDDEPIHQPTTRPPPVPPATPPRDATTTALVLSNGRSPSIDSAMSVDVPPPKSVDTEPAAETGDLAVPKPGGEATPSPAPKRRMVSYADIRPTKRQEIHASTPPPKPPPPPPPHAQPPVPPKQGYKVRFKEVRFNQNQHLDIGQNMYPYIPAATASPPALPRPAHLSIPIPTACAPSDRPQNVPSPAEVTLPRLLEGIKPFPLTRHSPTFLKLGIASHEHVLAMSRMSAGTLDLLQARLESEGISVMDCILVRDALVALRKDPAGAVQPLAPHERRAQPFDVPAFLGSLRPPLAEHAQAFYDVGIRVEHLAALGTMNAASYELVIKALVAKGVTFMQCLVVREACLSYSGQSVG